MSKILETLKYVDDCRKEGIELYNATKPLDAEPMSRNTPLEDVVANVKGSYSETGYMRPLDFPEGMNAMLKNVQPEIINGVEYVPTCSVVLEFRGNKDFYFKGASYFDAYKRYSDSSITVIASTSITSGTIDFDDNHLFDNEEGEYSYVTFYVTRANLSKIGTNSTYPLLRFSNATSGDALHYALGKVVELYINNISPSGNVSYQFTAPSYYTYSLRYIYIGQNYSLAKMPFSAASSLTYLKSINELELQCSNQIEIPVQLTPSVSKIILGNNTIAAFDTSLLSGSNSFFPTPLIIGGKSANLKNTTLVKLGTYATHLSVPNGLVNISIESSNKLEKISFPDTDDLKTLTISTSNYSLSFLKLPKSISTLTISSSFLTYVELYNDFDVNGLSFITKVSDYSDTNGMNNAWIKKLPTWLKDHSADGETRTITVGSKTLAFFTESQLAEIARKGWTIA